MANRLATGGFVTNGNYSGILGIALGANQFQGQVTNPNSQSIAIAQQALNGTLPNNTNGALYYGAPAPGNASWLNSLLSWGTGLEIGGNTFSDQMGPASAAYQAGISGSYGGSDPVSGASNFDEASGLSGYNTEGIFANLPDDTFDGGTSLGGIGSDAVAGGTAGAPDASSVDWSVLPDDAFDGSTAASGVAGGTSPISPSGMTGISSSGAVGTQGSVGSIGAGGIAVNLTDEGQLPTDVTGAGTAAKGRSDYSGVRRPNGRWRPRRHARQHHQFGRNLYITRLRDDCLSRHGRDLRRLRLKHVRQTSRAQHPEVSMTNKWLTQSIRTIREMAADIRNPPCPVSVLHVANTIERLVCKIEQRQMRQTVK